MDSGYPKDNTGPVTVDELIESARELVRMRVPYLHQGRNEFGLDCVGAPIFIMIRKGILPEEWEKNNYGRLPKAELLEKVKLCCVPLEKGTRGALTLVKWPGDALPSHAAICTGENLIHCYEQVGRMIEHGYRGHWWKRTHSTWSVPGVSYP